MKEIIVRMKTDHIKVKDGEYVADLVRCKDCKFYNGKYCISKAWPSMADVKPDGYCNFGEAKEG